jgi:carboxypeptidase PM20D1
MPGGIQGAAAALFAAVAPELPFGQRLALSNLWLTAPGGRGHAGQGRGHQRDDAHHHGDDHAQRRHQGQRAARPAEAVVNFRILPGDTANGAGHVKRAIADERIEVKPLGVGSNPSSVSSPEAPAFKLIERTRARSSRTAMVAPG